jgi:hypothetical protein
VIPARAGLAAVTLVCASGCGPRHPCDTSFGQRMGRFSLPYAGTWAVGRGDTLTLPEGMGDRFKLAGFRLDTARVAVNGACRFAGELVFTAPRAETLAVTWVGEPQQVYIFGWPAHLGPFAGIGASWWGRDSLRGAVLFDERMGVQMAPGVTAEFVAGRR